MTKKRLVKSILNVKFTKVLDFREETVRGQKSIVITVALTKGHQHLDPFTLEKCSGYDKRPSMRKWRALDWNGYMVYIECAVHRVQTKEHGVVTEYVPWARHHSNFTREFENTAVYFATTANKKVAATVLRVNWHTVGDMVSRVKEDLLPNDPHRFDNLKKIGIDETSYCKGHTYMTTVIDHDTKRIIWVSDGYGAEVLQRFFDLLTEEQKASIELVSGDGAKWIKTVCLSNNPNIKFCIDSYHVTSWAIDAMDEVRKESWHKALSKLNSEKKERKKAGIRKKKGEITEAEQNAKLLKSSKYPLGKNPENLTDYQMDKLEEIRKVQPYIYRAYQLKESLREVLHSDQGHVEPLLKKWLSWSCRSKIPSFVNLSKKIRRHYDDIIATITYGLSNARIEAFNHCIDTIIRKAYGFKNTENMFDMIMLVCGHVDIPLAYEMF